MSRASGGESPVVVEKRYESKYRLGEEGTVFGGLSHPSLRDK